jgi:hypothetical protein
MSLKKAVPFFTTLLLASAGLSLIVSCSKEGNNTPNPNNQKPRVGSKWVYRFTTYHAGGGVNTQVNVTYRATSMETLGGESWLKIVDSASGNLLFYLKEKSDGLYHYINNNAYLLCKNPAAVNDTYNGYSGTVTTDYTVTSINQMLAFGVLGNLSVNHYTGMSGGETVDQVWYNSRVWVAQRFMYTKPPLGSYYRNASLIIQDFIY